MRVNLTLKSLLISLMFFIPGISDSQILLRAPQKIVVDAPRNRLLVSNETTGDIIQIDSAGIQSYFVQGAGFVDGMEIVGDTVYGVANGRKIKAYNLVTKQLVMTVPFTGSASNYLSSITSDSSGHLFISCPFLNEIYRMRISDQSYWVFAKNNGLIKPNGILLEKEKNRIVVVSDSPNPSSIYAISLADSTVSVIATTSFNSPDGIVRDKYGYYYVGGYYLPGLYMIDPVFSQAPVLFFAGTSMVYPTYDKRDHSILITHYNTNTWERIPLTTTATDPVERRNAFVLHPVSPNPFQSVATIKFELNRNLPARIDIYDSNGRLIKTLVNEQKEPGTYTISWDGKNSSGDPAANGTYYFRMAANGNNLTQKAILIR